MTATLPAPAAPEDTDTTRSRRDELWRRWAPVLFVTPMAALAFLFMFFPAILTFIGSWFHIPLAGGQWTFVGSANYERLFTDPHSQKAISNTVIYSVGTIIPSLVLGLLLAMIANSLTRGRALVRTLLFLPMTANLVAMAVVFTYGFSVDPNEIGRQLGQIGESRTVGYAEHGAAGMLTLFVRGVLCNWMVSTGVVAAMMSTSVSGKVIAMWMPIMLFFYMGFEHSIVNMFLFPSGLMLGGDFTITDYLFWNEIPTVIGNLVGGLAFVGLTLFATHARTGAARTIDAPLPDRTLATAGNGVAK